MRQTFKELQLCILRIFKDAGETAIYWNTVCRYGHPTNRSTLISLQCAQNGWYWWRPPWNNFSSPPKYPHSLNFTFPKCIHIHILFHNFHSTNFSSSLHEILSPQGIILHPCFPLLTQKNVAPPPELKILSGHPVSLKMYSWV